MAGANAKRPNSEENEIIKWTAKFSPEWMKSRGGLPFLNMAQAFGVQDTTIGPGEWTLTLSKKGPPVKGELRNV